MHAQLHVRTSNDNSVYGIFSCVKFILLVTENKALTINVKAQLMERDAIYVQSLLHL